MKNPKLLTLFVAISILLALVEGLSRVDSNQDTYLTADEFFNFFRATRPHLSPQAISSIVADIFTQDLNKDGRLSESERQSFGGPGAVTKARPTTPSSAPFSPVPFQFSMPSPSRPSISYPPSQHNLRKRESNTSLQPEQPNNSATLSDNPSTTVMKVQTSSLVSDIVPTLLPLTPGPIVLLPKEELAILSAESDSDENLESMGSATRKRTSVTHIFEPMSDDDIHPINTHSDKFPIAGTPNSAISRFFEDPADSGSDNDNYHSNISNPMKIMYVITRDLDMSKFTIKIPYSDLHRTHLDAYCNLQRNRRHFLDSCIDLENLRRNRPVSTLPPPDDPVQYTSSSSPRVPDQV